MTTITFPDILFFFFAALIVVCGCIVVFSRNIVHSGFSLLGTFTGVAGFYGLLSAHFLAAVQILVYVGGVLIVILFAIMLTRDIQNVSDSNPTQGFLPATLLGLIIATTLIFIALDYPWQTKPLAEVSPSVPLIGNALLDKYLIPFEVLSLLLLAALIGAVMLVRKEIKEDKKDIQE